MTPQNSKIAPLAYADVPGRGDTRSPDDPEFVEVAPAALGAKGLLERENDAGYVVPVPNGAKDPVGKPAAGAVWSALLYPGAQQQDGWGPTSAHPIPSIRPHPVAQAQPHLSTMRFWTISLPR